MPTILLEDTTWLSGEKIHIEDTVQVADGVTLRIEPGVEVTGGEILVAGSILAEGTSESPVVFDGTKITAHHSELFHISKVVMRQAHTFMEFVGGSNIFISESAFLNGGKVFIDRGGEEELTIRNCAFLMNVEVFSAIRLRGESLIEGNYFSGNESVFKGGYFYDTTFVRSNTFENFKHLITAPFENISQGVVDFSGNFFSDPSVESLEGFVTDASDDIRLKPILFNPSEEELPKPDLPFVDFESFARNQIEGSDIGEFIEGNYTWDFICAKGGDDQVEGGRGDDIIDGGEGIDTAVLSYRQNSYTLTLSPEGTAIEDRRLGGDGLDELIDIEFIRFKADFRDPPFDLRIFGGPTELEPQKFVEIAELYIAYFNRAPDALGLYFWATNYAKGTITLEEMAALFNDQNETRETYSSDLSNSEFVTAIYYNVLGRSPDDEGFAFWVPILDQAILTRDTFILSILAGANREPTEQDSPELVANLLADQEYLSSKVDIGTYFAVHKGMSDIDNASAAMALFDGSEVSISEAASAIDAFHTAALMPTGGEFLMPLVGVLDDPFLV